jgi:TPR repeat protein
MLLGEVYAQGLIDGEPDYVNAVKFFTKGGELGSVREQTKACLLLFKWFRRPEKCCKSF